MTFSLRLRADFWDYKWDGSEPVKMLCSLISASIWSTLHWIPSRCSSFTLFSNKSQSASADYTNFSTKVPFLLFFSIFLLPVTTFYSHTCKYKLLHHSDTLSTAFLAEEAPSPFSQITLKQLRNIILTYLQRSCSSFTLFSKNFQTASADHTDFSTKSVNLCNGGVFGHANSLASCLLLSFRERVNFVSDPSLHYSRYYFLASYFFLCYRG